jgi:hypothetical protein
VGLTLPPRGGGHDGAEDLLGRDTLDDALAANDGEDLAVPLLAQELRSKLIHDGLEVTVLHTGELLEELETLDAVGERVGLLVDGDVQREVRRCTSGASRLRVLRRRDRLAARRLSTGGARLELSLTVRLDEAERGEWGQPRLSESGVDGNAEGRTDASDSSE